jgi:hypothetical protein
MGDRVYTAIDLYDRRGLRAQLRVAAVPWRGSYRAHVREYYPGQDGAMSPGRGAAFGLDKLDDVIYALQLMRQDRDAGKLEVLEHESQEGGRQAVDE